MADQSDGERPGNRRVALDESARREWLARPQVRRVLAAIAYYEMRVLPQDVDDLIQDFYAAKLRALSLAYDEDRQDLALVRAAFRNFARDWVKTRTTASSVAGLSFDDPNRSGRLNTLTAVPPFPEHLEPDQKIVAVRHAFRRLRPKDQQCMQLFHYQGKSIKAVSVALGISEGAAKVAIHRAKQNLTELVVDEGFCLSFDDVLDWPGFTAALADGGCTPGSTVARFSELLKNGHLGNSRPLVSGTDRRILLEGVNDVLRSHELVDILAPDPSASASQFPAKVVARWLRVRRNRYVTEKIFSPMIAPAAGMGEEL